MFDIEIVNKVMNETKEALEREKIEERFLTRMILSNKQFQQPLVVSQSRIKYFKDKLILLQDIIKEKQG